VHATGPPNYGFTPSTLSVAAGSKVVVTNDSQAAPHTWTADDGSFDSGTIAAGGTSAPITLTKKGTYGFYCEIHGAALMHGTVTVT
jgi:plastocyanin